MLELLPGTRYNFHPGSHKQGAEQGIIMIAELLNEIPCPQQQTMVLLETMAGKGSEVGRKLYNCVRLSTEWSCRENWGYVWIPSCF